MYLNPHFPDFFSITPAPQMLFIHEEAEETGAPCSGDVFQGNLDPGRVVSREMRPRALMPCARAFPAGVFTLSAGGAAYVLLPPAVTRPPPRQAPLPGEWQSEFTGERRTVP